MEFLGLTFAVFGASVLGSPHCLLMCGGLCAPHACGSHRLSFIYQIGRLLAYGCLLILFWTASAQFFALSTQPGLRLLGVSLVACAWTFVSINLWNGKTIAIPGVHSVSRLLIRKKPVAHQRELSSFLAGILTVILPCGWLYGVLAGIALSKSFPQALILCLVFWIGTLPAVMGAASAFNIGLTKRKTWIRRLTAFAFFFLGLSSMIGRIDPRYSLGALISPNNGYSSLAPLIHEGNPPRHELLFCTQRKD